MDTSLFGLSKPGARGTHPSSNELRDALRANADRFDILLQQLSDGMQEGVVGAGDGLVTRLDANTIRVAAGVAWIDGDSVSTGLTGRCRVSWPQTDLAVARPASSGLERGYRVTVPIPTGGHGASAPALRVGTDQAAVDHDALQGVPALAIGQLQLATVIANFSNGIEPTSDASNGIRDRRSFARGARYQRRKITTEPSLSNATPVLVFGDGAAVRMELPSANLVEVGMDFRYACGTGEMTVELVVDGIIERQWPFTGGGAATLHAPLSPGVGSHLFLWRAFRSAGSVSVAMDVFSPMGAAYAWAREAVGGIGNDGAV